MAERLPVQVRDEALLSAARMAAADAISRGSSARSQDFARGAVAAYDWLLGTQSGPLSSSTRPSAVRDLLREEDLAEGSIYRRPDAVEVAQSWAVGVQQALLWARGVLDRPPIELPDSQPAPPPQLRSRDDICAAGEAARRRMSAGAVRGLETYDGGVTAACQWLLGESSIAPVSAESCVMTLERACAEYDTARAAAQRRPGAVDVDQRFAQGAAATLLWATRSVARAPIRLPGPSTG